MVTGATSGLGREIAVQVATRGARAVVVGRGAERAALAAREIGAHTGSTRVESVAVSDLAERPEQRRLAEELRRRYPRIDVLVNNAGGMFARREVTRDGLERTFALNVLAPYFLTQALADPLRAGGPGRVVNIASAAHYRQHVDFEDLQGVRAYRGWRAYGRSKLELILLTRAFARRFGREGPTVNAVHPGFVRTGFAQNNGGALAGMVRFAAWIGGRSVARGAETPVFVALDPSVAGVTGAYFADRAVRSGSTPSRDMAAADRLFEACEGLARAV